MKITNTDQKILFFLWLFIYQCMLKSQNVLVGKHKSCLMHAVEFVSRCQGSDQRTELFVN